MMANHSAQAAPSPQKIIILGDSLSEGHGVPADQSYVSLMQARLSNDPELKDKFTLMNSSISGSTTASAPERTQWLLKHISDPSDVALFIIELGANDGLRGRAIKDIKTDLKKTLAQLRAKKIPTALFPVDVPDSYGTDAYANGFRNLFKEVAKEDGAILFPSILRGVGGVVALNQADGSHPNQKGHEKIAELFYPDLKKALLKLPVRSAR